MLAKLSEGLDDIYFHKTSPPFLNLSKARQNFTCMRCTCVVICWRQMFFKTSGVGWPVLAVLKENNNTQIQSCMSILLSAIKQLKLFLGLKASSPRNSNKWELLIGRKYSFLIVLWPQEAKLWKKEAPFEPLTTQMMLKDLTPRWVV